MLSRAQIDFRPHRLARVRSRCRPLSFALDEMDLNCSAVPRLVPPSPIPATLSYLFRSRIVSSPRASRVNAKVSHRIDDPQHRHAKIFRAVLPSHSIAFQERLELLSAPLDMPALT